MVAKPTTAISKKKADNYECLKDPAHRRAPVYTLRVYSRGSATRDCKSADVQSVNAGFYNSTDLKKYFISKLIRNIV